jgi:hypothetical protein
MAQDDTKNAAKITAGTPTVQELQEKLQAANAKLQSYGITENLESDIAQRMRLGLDHDMAVKCARRQAATNDVTARKWDTDSDRQAALVTAGSLP